MADINKEKKICQIQTEDARMLETGKMSGDLWKNINRYLNLNGSRVSWI